MKPDTSAEAVEQMTRHLAPLLMGTTLQGAPDIFRALAAERDAARAEAARLREAHNDLDAWATAEVARLKRLWTYMQEAAADPDADEPMTAAEWLAEFTTAEQQTRAALAGEAGA